MMRPVGTMRPVGMRGEALGCKGLDGGCKCTGLAAKLALLLGLFLEIIYFLLLTCVHEILTLTHIMFNPYVKY